MTLPARAAAQSGAFAAIAERFIEAARRALVPGGTLLLVTKQPSWYLESLPRTWTNVAREEVKTYHLIEAVLP